MKLFIFKPSKYWDYCGGLLLWAAEKQDDLPKIHIEIYNLGGDEYRTEHTLLLEDYDQEPRKSWDIWMLSKTIEINDPNIQPGLVEINYNYS